MPIPEIPAWILSISAAAGSALASFYAARARAANKKIERTVQSELEGPENEPGMRQMIKDSHEFAIECFKSLHSDSVHMTGRMDTLENTISKGVEDRLKNLEQSQKDNTLMVTAIKSLENRVSNLGDILDRAGLNIHLIANAVQVKLLTKEEASQIMSDRLTKVPDDTHLKTKQP